MCFSEKKSPEIYLPGEGVKSQLMPGDQGHEEDHERPKPRISRADGVDHLGKRREKLP